jgi:hypothetical protein
MFGYAKELVRTNHNVTRECSVHAVAHTPPVSTKNEIAGKTILTSAARHCRGTQNGATITLEYVFDVLPDFDYNPGEFVA